MASKMNDLLNQFIEREKEFERWSAQMDEFHRYKGEIQAWEQIPEYVSAKYLGVLVGKTTLVIPEAFRGRKEDFLLMMINFMRAKAISLYGDSIQMTRRGKHALGFMKSVGDKETGIAWINLSRIEGSMITVEYQYGAFINKSEETHSLNEIDGRKRILNTVMSDRKVKTLNVQGSWQCGCLALIVLPYMMFLGSLIDFFNGELSKSISSGAIGKVTSFIIFTTTTFLFGPLANLYLVRSLKKKVILSLLGSEISYTPSASGLYCPIYSAVEIIQTENDVEEHMKNTINNSHDHIIFRDAIIGIFQEAKAMVEANQK